MGNKFVPNQNSYNEVILSSAKQMAGFFKEGDYKGYLKYVHSSLIQAAGGGIKMIGYLDGQKIQMKEQKIVLGDIVFHPPTEMIKTEKDLQCTISQQTELKTLRGKIRTFSTLIAISLITE